MLSRYTFLLSGLLILNGTANAGKNTIDSDLPEITQNFISPTTLLKEDPLATTINIAKPLLFGYVIKKTLYAHIDKNNTNTANAAIMATGGLLVAESVAPLAEAIFPTNQYYSQYIIKSAAFCLTIAKPASMILFSMIPSSNQTR